MGTLPPPDSMEQTLRKTLARIQGNNPENWSDQDRVDNVRQSDQMTIEAKAKILSTLPEAKAAGLGWDDIFYWLMKNEQADMVNNSAKELRSRGVPANATTVDFFTKVLQSLDERLQTVPGSDPILGTKRQFRKLP